MACDAVPHPLPPGMREGISFSLRWHSLPSKRERRCFFSMNSQNNQIRKIALSGLFIATSIILTRLFAGNIVIGGISVVRLSFGQVPLFLSGFLLGPVYGALCGAIADAVGYFLNPLGPYFPGFTLNAALSGMIPGLFARFMPKNYSWKRILLVIAISEFITSVCLTPLWLSMMTGKAFIAYVPSNIISRIILVPMHTSIVKLVLKYSHYAIPNLR